jgi:hypothetical protein
MDFWDYLNYELNEQGAVGKHETKCIIYCQKKNVDIIKAINLYFSSEVKLLANINFYNIKN